MEIIALLPMGLRSWKICNSIHRYNFEYQMFICIDRTSIYPSKSGSFYIFKDSAGEPICDTCYDYVLHTLWHHSEGPELGRIATWNSLTESFQPVDRAPSYDVFPNLNFGFNGKYFLVGSNLVSL